MKGARSTSSRRRTASRHGGGLLLVWCARPRAPLFFFPRNDRSTKAKAPVGGRTTRELREAAPACAAHVAAIAVRDEHPDRQPGDHQQCQPMLFDRDADAIEQERQNREVWERRY